MMFANLLAQPGVAKILQLLNQNGQQSRIVGGAVRNTLMGLPLQDIDITTSATPSQIIALADKMKIRFIPVGLAHGTVTLMVDGQAFEVTTLRADIKTDGRRAEVRFSRDFEVDALRRDFTINSLSVSSDGTLYDYTGGLADIKERRIRFIGSPQQRIQEDRLRILRFYRFFAAYGEGSIDQAGLVATIDARAELGRLSPERLQSEIMRLLLAPLALKSLQIMSDAGLLMHILGGVGYLQRFARLGQAQPNSDPILRLAALSLAVEEDGLRLRDHLRLSNSVHRRLIGAARILAIWHGQGAPPNRHSLLGAMMLYGREATIDGLSLLQAEAPMGHAVEYHEALHFLANAKAPKLPLSGHDVLKSVPLAGAKVGAILKTLQARWIRAGFPKEPALLAELLEQAIASVDVSS